MTQTGSQWTWPKVDGLHNFGGTLMHSAAWDEQYNFSQKKVAVIGIGSSAVQLLPHLAKCMYVRRERFVELQHFLC